MSHLESGVLEVHDGVGDADVQLEDDLLDIEGTSQSVHQTQETLCKTKNMKIIRYANMQI
jgi:hypothetical protein